MATNVGAGMHKCDGREVGPGGLWVASFVYSPMSGLSGVDVLYMSHRVDAGMQRRALHCRQRVHARVVTHVAAVRHHHSRVRMSR